MYYHSYFDLLKLIHDSSFEKILLEEKFFTMIVVGVFVSSNEAKGILVLFFQQ